MAVVLKTVNMMIFSVHTSFHHLPPSLQISTYLKRNLDKLYLCNGDAKISNMISICPKMKMCCSNDISCSLSQGFLQRKFIVHLS